MASPQPATAPPRRLSTGVAGLDDLLAGGLLPERAYLVRGGPGTGKTILGLHFAIAGARAGEPALYITLGEPESELRQNAQVLGFDLSRVSLLDLTPPPETLSQAPSYDLFVPAAPERSALTRQIIDQVTALRPQRIVVDAITQFRYLVADPLEFRKQTLAFLQFLKSQGATVLLTSETSPLAPDDDLQFLSDGIIELEIGPEGRTVSIRKLRGSDFRSGRHTVRLTDHGMEVYPRLVPEWFGREFVAEPISSGVPELDELLHGGLERGTVTIVTGPTGVGKTTFGIQFMKEAAGRGERSVVYMFDESVATLVQRSENVNIPVRAMMERGMLALCPIEPLVYSHDEFARLVRTEVEEKQARIVMLDSLAGYRLAVRGEDFLRQFRALIQYLKNMGVTALVVAEVETITGEFRATDIGASHLADNIVFLRYIEVGGELRKAIGVLKKRVSSFERTLREIELTRYGLKVGRPLTGLRGILRGVPELVEAPRQ